VHIGRYRTITNVRVRVVDFGEGQPMST